VKKSCLSYNGDETDNSCTYPLLKPFDIDALINAIKREDKIQTIQKSVPKITKNKKAHTGFLGTSKALESALNIADKASKTDASILLLGQSGVGKEVFANACQRCHSIKYGDFYGGSMAAKTPDANIKSYMGKMPPDLSQYIRSRGEHYLHEFINDPQKHLKGTAMPRVGLTQESEHQVVEYMEEVGESKKAIREALGPKFLGYLVIFTLFAWLWKAKIWREVH